MAQLENEARPEGQREEYRFIRNAESGRTFKVLPHFEEAPGCPPTLKLSLSEVDDSGKAIVAEEGIEPELFWHSHTFNDIELEDPDFDIESRIAAMLYAAVENHETKLKGREEVAGMIEGKWKGRASLDLTPPPEPVTPKE
ncbi:MAG: hypothetical protein H0U52_15215 [Chloroflexi bacterium]|nr:hypothetical protein [Chloroflexota bacterium]